MGTQGTILIVDDHDASRYTRSRVLSRAGYHIIEAENGTRALEMVALHRPDLVVLDVQLPDINGLDVCRRIKQDQKLAVIPVLHMSATNISLPDQVMGLEGGADGYLVEPIAPEILVATVGALLRARCAEAKANEASRALAVLVENLPGAAYRTESVGGRLSFVSGKVRELVGRSPDHASSVPGGWWDLVPVVDRAVLEEARQKATLLLPFEFKYRIQRPDGAVRWIWDRVSPVRSDSGELAFWEGFATDNTDQKIAQDVIAREQERLEELVKVRTHELQQSHNQLRLTERLAALGTLSAGLGHDMGNLLLPVRVRLNTLRSLPLPEEARADIDALSESFQYLAKLSAGLRLLAVDSASTGVDQAVEVHEWWSEVTPLLRSTLPKQLELRGILPPEPAWIAMSKNGLTQAVFNLVQNAGDAMKQAAGGSVTVRVERAGADIHVTVSDTGPGMSPEVLARCIEPFFTTKPRGLSTGLGLALVYGLVTEAHGELTVESTLGVGSSFTMRLRAAHPRPSQATCEMPPVVEIQVQDARIRAMVASEARRLGCQVRPFGETSSAVRVVDVPQDGQRSASPIIFIGDDAHAPASAVVVPARPRLADLRKALIESLNGSSGGGR